MINERFTNLAVAESKQFFALIPTHKLTKCKQDSYTVCSVDRMLKTDGEPNCLTAINFRHDRYCPCKVQASYKD